MIKNKLTLSHLTGYSSLAASILATCQSDAQIVYHDIDDIKVQSPDVALIDLNADGLFDYGFQTKNVEGLNLASVIDAFSNNYQNEVAGTSHGTDFRPFKLDFLNSVNSNLNWVPIIPLVSNSLLVYSSESSYA